jgi:hypothetical protein
LVGLTIDQFGDLYGAVPFGGVHGAGAEFELKRY